MSKASYLDILDLRGGRNGADPPLTLSPDQVVAAVNVDWNEGTIARKRNGFEAVAFGGTANVTAPVVTLIRYTPTENESAAELWLIDNDKNVNRYSGGAWAAITPVDAISAAPAMAQGASLNSKLFIAHKSTVDRLHVWDGTTLRRVGLAQPGAAPTAANTGSGSYAATVRYYRVRFTAQNASGVTIRRSEPSATLTFTPSGSGTGVVVTRPALAANEPATHWELYGSNDNANFWKLTTVAIGTTTHTDSVVPASYSSQGSVDYRVSEFLPFPSVKYLLTDENRLIGAGSWENAAHASRLFFSPEAGAGVGDDERTVDRSDWQLHLDLDAQDGGGITGLGGPINNSPYVFKYSQTYKLVRTGKYTVPYRPVTISKTIGCIAQRSIVEAVDENSRTALYFLAADGPRRISAGDGMQWLGSDVRDIWKTLNVNAYTVAHGVYYRDMQQVWWWIATGESSTPNALLVYDVRLGRAGMFGVTRGWSTYNGSIATANCSVMFANTLGAYVSTDLKPYIGLGNALKKCGTGTDDGGTPFKSYVKTVPFLVNGLGRKAGVTDGTLLAVAASGVTIQVTVDRDFGVETRNFSVSLTPAASESRVIRQIEDLSMADATALQFEIGDAEAVSNAWTLEAMTVRPRGEGDR